MNPVSNMLKKSLLFQYYKINENVLKLFIISLNIRNFYEKISNLLETGRI